MYLIFLLMAQLVPNDLYPYPDVMSKARDSLLNARSMLSDVPEVYRFTWSFFLEGECPNTLVLSDSSDEGMPCSMAPYVPLPDQIIPASLWTSYQQLVYTPPSSPTKEKASLALSHTYSLYSAGLMWHLTVTAEGIKHDIWFCEYSSERRQIEIAPLVFITVTFLKPFIYHHVTVKPSGNYNIQSHKIRQWDMPLGVAMQHLMYDVTPLVPKCGTENYVYTSQPGEVLMDLFSGLMPDSAQIMGGDQQIIVAPSLGTATCGEYGYSAFLSYMTHRSPETPSLFAEGPPLEVWSFQDERDITSSTAAVVDPEQDVEHQRMGGLQEDLREKGLSGPFVMDEDLQEALDAQAVVEDERFKSGADLGRAALSLLGILRANPRNTDLWELYQRYLSPHIDHIEYMNDTEIEFNPFGPHCVEDGEYVAPYLGHIPILGQHYFPDLEDCRFCDYHDRILAQPRKGWSHKRLLEMDWNWGSIHGARGNLREKAHAFIQRLMLVDLGFPARDTMADTQTSRAQRQLLETHQGNVDGVALETLEREPSETTTNTTRANESEQIPAIFLETFDPCTDPSWTIEFLLLYGEIEDIFNAPCNLLWGVL